MSATWKRPLKRSLITTPIAANRRGLCYPLCVHRYIYSALANAGIENRSPFNLLEILRIWIKARGRPAAVRSLCLNRLDSMQKPSSGFNHAYTFIALLSTGLMLWTLLTPQTANTRLTRERTDSILQFVIQPLPDLDSLGITLPMASDYQESPYMPGMHHPNGLANAQWIRQQNDDDYALQLISASDPQGLENFCSRHRICGDSAFYATELNGAVIYRLLYGRYPSNKAARLAIENLPNELQKFSPWSRQFRQIKQEIPG